MKKHLFIFIAVFMLIPNTVLSQTDAQRAEDEKQIRQVVENVFAAWKAGDGIKYADNFTDDVDYTVWNGMQLKGREANIKGHQQIFDTFYKGTEVRSEITKMRFLTEDVAVVHLKGRLYKDDEIYPNVPPVVPLMILKKENGIWRIAVFQNTPVIKQGELIVGRTNDSREEKQK